MHEYNNTSQITRKLLLWLLLVVSGFIENVIDLRANTNEPDCSINVFKLFVLLLQQVYLILDGIGFEGMQSVHMPVYMNIISFLDIFS